MMASAKSHCLIASGSPRTATRPQHHRHRVHRALRHAVAASATPDKPRPCKDSAINRIIIPSDIWRGLGVCTAAAALSILPANEAMAARLSAPMENIAYKEVKCGSSKTGFTCVEFSGQVTNKDKKSINTADIYGRIYDSAQNDVTDNEENDRIGYVDEVKPGTSTVSFVITVPKAQLEMGPLKWKGLKVSGYTGKVLPGQAGLLGLPEDLDCSAIGPDSDILDVEACDEQAAELSIR